MGKEEIAAFDLLSRMRFACGDNGKRMQGELEVYLRELKRDAERYRWVRGVTSPGYLHFPNGEMPDGLALEALDEAIDAAIAGATDQVQP